MAAWLAVAWSRIRGLFVWRADDVDFDAEIAAHLQMLVDEDLRHGMTEEEARRAARLAFGGSMQTVERHREGRSLPLIEATLQDVRYALRSLWRYPGFSLVAIATLAAGIGAGTAVFSFAGAVLLKPLPYARPDELVRIFETNPLKKWTRNIASPANYADWKARNGVFTDVAAYEQFSNTGSGAEDVFLTGRGEPQGLKALGVSGNLFRTLGTAPLVGRTFADDEEIEGKHRVAVLSYGLWQSAFGGDRAIVGSQIALNGRTFDVVGVMPRDFFFPGKDVQIWLPFGYAQNIFQQARRPHWLGVIARRKPGVSLPRAQNEMDAIAAALERQYPDTNTKMGVRLEGFHDSLAYNSKPALVMLSGAVGLLFLIVCVNIANLQLGRAASRTRELGIRRALGAGRGRLVRQLITEGVVLSAIGGAAGFALAVASHSALLSLAASAVPVFANVVLDRTVAIVAAALTLTAPVVFAIGPAVAGTRTGSLADRTDTGSPHAGFVRSTLVAGEVALSIMLIVSALLLVRSLLRLQQVDPGFKPDQVSAFTITLPGARYPNAAARLKAFRDVEARLASVPGIESIGASSALALRGYTWTGDATVEGRAPTDYERELRHESVLPGYFKTMGIPLLGGRMLDDRDGQGQPLVTVVNQALETQYFRGQSAVGKRITFARPQDNQPWVTIVGVVANQKQDGMDKPAQPEVYVPLAQQTQNPLTFVVRATGDPERAIAAARSEVRAVDKDLALTEVTTLDDLVHESLGNERFRTTLLTGFAGVALFLAALGIYGVLAYSVAQRMRELGIRLALGAQPGAVFRMVICEGMRPVVIGGAAGIAGALAASGLIKALLFGIEPLDPATYVVALIVLGCAAFAACALPAARATHVDPLVAVRNSD
jgi:putative ABC transport system permease protein